MLLAGALYFLVSLADETAEITIDDDVIRRADPWEIVDPLWWSVNIYDGPAAYQESLSRFSRNQSLVHAISWYDAEVLNGGHHQFFANSTGIVWRNALEGFRTIGLKEAADILSEAAERLGGAPSLDRTLRNDQLDRIDIDGLNDLDHRYYALREVLIDRLAAFIQENKEDFYFKGKVKRP